MAPAQHVIVRARDLLQQRAVDEAHRLRGQQRRAIFGGQRALRGLVKRSRAIGLELHQPLKARAVHAVEDLLRAHAKSREIVERQIDSAPARILADIAQDIGQLEGDSKVVGVDARDGIAIAENLDTHQPDGRGHAIAVETQIVEGLIARAREVHLDAVDKFVEIAARDIEAAHAVGQRARDRASRLAAEDALQLLAPSSEQHGRVAHPGLVRDVVDKAAEGVDGVERAAALRSAAG